MGDRSELEPDLALLRARPDGYRTPPRPSAAEVLLIIEVSDISVHYDREVKLALYARHGVTEVWFVDLAARAVEVHRKPEGEAYAEVATRGGSDTVEPFSLPGVRISVGEIV